MKKTLLLVLVLAPASAAAEESTYNAKPKGGEVKHDCAKEADVTVNINSTKFTFIGTCNAITLNGNKLSVKYVAIKDLTVNGNDGAIEGDALDEVTVNGSKNTVSYKKHTDGKSKTGVQNNGRSNTINVAK